MNATIHISRGIPLRTLAFAVLVSLSLTTGTLRAQMRPAAAPKDTVWTYDGLNLKQWGALGLASGIFIGLLVDSYNAWWAGNRAKFGFYKPSQKGGWFWEPGILGIDKAGHAFSAYFFYRIQKAVFEWGGFTPRTSTWLSAGFSWSVMALIEVGDGFSNYAFDFRDLIMNTLGVLFGVGRTEVPFMRHFNYKWSYAPETLSFRTSQHYHASTFWLTADVVSMIDGNTGDPFIVQPAIGYSVTEKGGAGELMVGIDLDFNKLLRSNNEYLEVFRKIVDPLHVPMPGVKFSPSYHPRYKALLLR